MIKLLWNTHHQKEPKSNDKKVKEKQEQDYGWGHYHQKSSDKWIYEILEKVDYQIIESEKNLQKEDILIIVDSSVEEKVELYTKLNAICSRIFLVSSINCGSFNALTYCAFKSLIIFFLLVVTNVVCLWRNCDSG